MRISGANGATIDIDAAGDGDGDCHVTVAVSVEGFAGTTTTFVVGDAWRGFVSQVVALDASRRGAAVLESVSPGEVRLTVRATDRAGHMAVEGSIGVRDAFRKIALTFSPIEFEPTELPRIVRELRAMPDEQRVAETSRRRSLE